VAAVVGDDADLAEGGRRGDDGIDIGQVWSLPAGESMRDPQSLRDSQVTKAQGGGPAVHRSLAGCSVIDTDNRARQRLPLILQ
jgi:hypothetical protein